MVGRPGNEAKAFPLSSYCILYISNQHLGWWEGLGTRLFNASVSTCFFCALKASLTASWSRFESFLFFWLFLRCWSPSFRVRTVSSSTRLMVPSPNHSTQNWGGVKRTCGKESKIYISGCVISSASPHLKCNTAELPLKVGRASFPNLIQHIFRFLPRVWNWKQSVQELVLGMGPETIGWG